MLGVRTEKEAPIAVVTPEPLPPHLQAPPAPLRAVSLHLRPAPGTRFAEDQPS